MNLVRNLSLVASSVVIFAASALAQGPGGHGGPGPVYGSPVGHGGGPGQGAPGGGGFNPGQQGPRPGQGGPGMGGNPGGGFNPGQQGPRPGQGGPVFNPGQGGFNPGQQGPRPGQGGPIYNPGPINNGPRPGPYQPAPGPVYGSPVGHGGPVYNPGPYNPGYPGPVYNPGPVYHPPVYNPGPVYGGIYNGPIYQGPVFHFPTYPVYNTFPQGPCTVYSNSYSGSGAYYSVTNAYGQTIGTTYDYNQAYQIAQSAQNSLQCSYINNLTNSYQSPNFCQIMPGGNSYGQDFYRVIDNQGRILRDSCSYQDALNTVQTTAQCYQQ